jgi:hypothetical protein
MSGAKLSPEVVILFYFPSDTVFGTIKFECYLLPSLYAASFVRRTTSSTDLHPFLKRSLYLLRFSHFIVYTGCGTVLKKSMS